MRTRHLPMRIRWIQEAVETDKADVPVTAIEDEPSAEESVEAVSDVEPEEQPEINAEIDYLPESSVLPSAHAFLRLDGCCRRK